MKGSVGCPMQIKAVLPNLRKAAELHSVKLSKEARHRLEILDWYFKKSGKGSASGKPNAALTCRHFGIHRSYFYRWLKRYDRKNLATLEEKSTAPARRRKPCYSRELVEKVRKIREEDQTYSGKKIRPILLRSEKAEDVPSVATLGRLINRENLYFRADVARHKKKSKSAKAAQERKRKPYDLKASKEVKIVEFDMKHAYVLDAKHYAFCAIDVLRKEALVHIASTSSSLNGKKAMEKVITRFGKDVIIVNDWGSENMDKVEKYLAAQGITQYWAKPHTPKDKPHIERFIGTLQRECLDYNYDLLNVSELQTVVDNWLDKYHFYRPHEGLNFLTPAEFSAKMGVSIPHRGVSYS